MIIGKKPKAEWEGWGAGVQFELRTYNDPSWSPRFEIWCYKLKEQIVRKMDKKNDIQGFWRIWWWQPRITVEKTQTIKNERKGWRTKKVEMKIPVTFIGKLRSW